MRQDIAPVRSARGSALARWGLAAVLIAAAACGGAKDEAAPPVAAAPDTLLPAP
ncbi:MAG: hypothetical protein H3C62_12140, partial [Gemmatimonadaceae bacterium]|nr:hypothetical protein [Gemmatimonadaceae bacterium]